MPTEERLRERLDNVLRTSAGDQAKAYQDYAALLDRLASRKIRTVEFARDAVDLYIGAVGKAASSGVKLLGEAVSAGIKGVGAAAEALEKQMAAAESGAARPASGATPGTAVTGGKAPGKG